MAADKDGASFEPDGDVQKIAELYALDAVDSAKKQFGVTLDWSDESVARVEAILSQIHTSYINTTPRPPEAMVVTFAKMYGS